MRSRCSSELGGAGADDAVIRPVDCADAATVLRCTVRDPSAEAPALRRPRFANVVAGAGEAGSQLIDVADRSNTSHPPELTRATRRDSSIMALSIVRRSIEASLSAASMTHCASSGLPSGMATEYRVTKPRKRSIRGQPGRSYLSLTALPRSRFGA